jgi:hypothetical protein
MAPGINRVAVAQRLNGLMIYFRLQLDFRGFD